MSSDCVAPSGTTCSYVPPETSRLVIDPDGDLTLKVGQMRCIKNTLPNGSDSEHCDPGSDHKHELPVIYTVCSRTLSRASRVWKALLYGGFAESKPSCASAASDWLVELPDDNPKAMATILNIIHSRFESIPRIKDPIDLEDLYQLTVLTDKYDLTAILRPWASSWMQSAEEKLENWRVEGIGSFIPHLARLSWIAWEIGDPFVYKSVLGDLARYCSVDINGDLQYDTGSEIVTLFTSTLEPPGLHGALKVVRLSYITNAIGIYQKAIETLLLPLDFRKPTLCISHISRDEMSKCEAAMLGAMIRSLAQSGYWPLPAATNVRESISSIWRVLKTIVIKSPVHSNCSGVGSRDGYFKLYWESTVTLTSTVALTSTVTERMAKQAAKSGL
ncbi:hypothetical protein F4824DRAFT_479144 [Ustulina deusta]|nr:hypothetical protein F4824DRAFT_479144 [Ustulina deusta]